jgi:hypothetical protein
MKFVTKQNFSMAVYDAYGVQQYYWPDLSKIDPENLLLNLRSNELPGAGGVGLKYSGTVADALVDIYVDALGDFKNTQDGCTEAILAAVAYWGGRTDSAYVQGQKSMAEFIFQMVPMH